MFTLLNLAAGSPWFAHRHIIAGRGVRISLTRHPGLRSQKYMAIAALLASARLRVVP